MCHLFIDLITGGDMGQSHSKTKRKRRQKSDKRKDYTAATMAKLRQLEQAASRK
jgi:hypothetical protein